MLFKVNRWNLCEMILFVISEKVVQFRTFIIIGVLYTAKKKLREQAKELRKSCKTAMHWHKMDSTRVSMPNTEKKT